MNQVTESPQPDTVTPDSNLPEWSAPTLTRIELKRTMLASGIFTDADGFSTGN